MELEVVLRVKHTELPAVQISFSAAQFTGCDLLFVNVNWDRNEHDTTTHYLLEKLPD